MKHDTDRYISNLTKDTYALVLAGGRGEHLFELTERCAKSSVYFGGNFRVIDFTLSNCVNSGINHIGVATRYQSHSLIRHINRGWRHNKANQSESVEILPATQRVGNTSGCNWYTGTADAVYQNLNTIRHERPKYILVLSGDHVYRMDYGVLLARHIETNADVTVCSLEVSSEEAANNFGVITVNSDNKVTGFEEKPAHPKQVPSKPGQCLASMGSYVFNSEFLFEQLEKDANNQTSSHNFGKDIIPSIIHDHNVSAFIFKTSDGKNQPYWQSLSTIDSYWKANMDLVEPKPQLDLYDTEWPIWTYQEQLPPAKLIFDNDLRRGMAVDSTVSCGCIISGSTVRKSLLFPSVHTHSHSIIKESIIMHDSDIGESCKLRKVIVASQCKIPAGLVIGYDKEQDIANGFRVSEKGITLVTREMLETLAKKQVTIS